MYGILPMDPHGHCSEHLTPGLSFIGYYDNGQPKGPCWRQLVGGSWMYGILKENGEFTGTANMAYIYQDLELAMVGNYNKGLLVSIILKKIVATFLLLGLFFKILCISQNKAGTNY